MRQLLLFLIVSLRCTTYSLLGQEYHVRYIEVKDGLSHNEVTSITKDQYGFMWFGTRGGLDQYNGVGFKHFNAPLNRTNGISNPSIESLGVDHKGNLLIGTKSGGFNYYETSKDKFINNFLIAPVEAKRVTSLLEDSNHNLWFGTWRNGVYFIPSNNDQAENIFQGSCVHCMTQTPDETMWFGTSHGLKYKKKGKTVVSQELFDGHHEITDFYYDKHEDCLWMVGWKMSLIKYSCADNSFQVIDLFDADKNKITGYSIIKDGPTIWIGTMGKGLYQYDENTGSIKQFNLDIWINNDVLATANIILDIYKDDVGDIWLGTEGMGVVHLSLQKCFYELKDLQEDKNIHLQVSSLIEDQRGSFWIATKNSGFYCLRNRTLKRIPFLDGGYLKSSEEIDFLYVYQDQNQIIWVSTGINIYILQEHQPDKWCLVTPEAYFGTKVFNIIRKVQTIFEHGNQIWIGTQQQGLYVYEKDADGYHLKTHFREGQLEGDLKDERITSIVKNHEGQIFVATYKGLFLYNEKKNSFIDMRTLINNSSQRLCDIILCLYCDDQNILWFGTPWGLNKLTSTADNLYISEGYTTTNGLLNDYVSSIVGDHNGNLWFTTKLGISSFNKISEEILNYSVQDGISGTNFFESSVFYNNNEIYFGGFNGLTYFNPDSIQANLNNPNLAITNFSIFNKPVLVTDNGVLTSNINEQSCIELDHNNSEFSFEFSSLDYRASKRNLYAYKLEGANNDWIYLGDRHYVTFNNLDPKIYNFKIKGTNSNGHWSDKTYQLRIRILPAPWRSWMAVVGYILLILWILYLLLRVHIKQERLKNKANLERVKREKETELNDYKLRFFTNISHELRTPLTMIYGPIQELNSKEGRSLSSDQMQWKHQLIYQNAKRLYRLTNQLLDFRRQEVGKLRLEAEEVNLKEFLEQQIFSFRDLAVREGVELNVIIKGGDWNCFADVDKLTTIIYNLLSNALIYSGANGEVTVVMQSELNQFKIEISNNGKGINPKDISNLFKRFYQAGSDHPCNSSGIGLSLVKSYVELHKGYIEVESIVHKITTFTIVLPKGKQHLEEDQIRIVQQEKSQYFKEQLDTIDIKRRSVNTGTKGAKVLVLEDNEEVRSYLVDLLSERYEVIEVSNGHLGYKLIIDYHPDIIISDVMMPMMDGYELCQKVKSNHDTAHIPVILLTARGTVQDELFGTQKGADAYLTKPFVPELLLEKVKVLLVLRATLSNKFTKKVKLEPTNIEITSDQEKFITTLTQLIESNITNSDLDIDTMGKEMAMSPSTLYRKIKKITQKTPVELIRYIRFQRAAQLLKESDISVTEVAEMVGYTDMKSFRSGFRKLYNQTPTEYRNP
ncbi:two-component regulator propeller domain-containing protein [Prolixibacteraceae bacterium]|nr:two-component regulator propeller domain-containing protein [Prolixibacteraceae bacterium]